jgi:WD40 repeat protein
MSNFVGMMTPAISSSNPNIPIACHATSLLQMPLVDTFVQILTRLPARDIGISALVCRQWNQILTHEFVWCTLFNNHFPTVDTSNIKNFQDAYKTLCFNLTKGVYASQTLQEHEGWVLSLATSHGKLFSASADCTIKVWDIKTGEFIITLKGHTSWVTSLGVAEGKLFSGSTEGFIRIWDIATGKCIKAFQGHANRISSFAVADGKLFSASQDRTIKIWDANTGEYIKTLKGHLCWVTSLAVAEKMLFSGSADNNIKFWNITTGKCLATLKGHWGRVSSLAIADGKLFSGSYDRTIKIWDIATRKCTATLEGRHAVHSFVVVDRKLFFAASEDDIITVWDIKAKQCIATLNGHTDWAVALAFTDDKLFSGSHDRTIKVWDFTANHHRVFQEIAQLFETGSLQAIEQAFERFSKMPKKAKNAIYGKLYEICKPFEMDDPKCAKYAFYGIYSQRSTSAQKVQAIRDYLEEEPLFL